jgi:hypothetical protein
MKPAIYRAADGAQEFIHCGALQKIDMGKGIQGLLQTVVQFVGSDKNNAACRGLVGLVHQELYWSVSRIASSISVTSEPFAFSCQCFIASCCLSNQLHVGLTTNDDAPGNSFEFGGYRNGYANRRLLTGVRVVERHSRVGQTR